MRRPRPAGSLRGLDRIIVFADAVVAIAITLLILPLVDIATHSLTTSVARLISDHIGQLAAFALSFVVIARLWTAHHEIFERLRGYDIMLLRLTLLWLLTVVFLPFPTELLVRDYGRASTLYIATLLVGSVALASSAAWADAHPALQQAPAPAPGTHPPRWTTSVLLVVSLALTVLLPWAGMWSLLLLLLADPIDAVWRHLGRPIHPSP
jgi:uncharacterized membrane protein